MAVCRGEKKAPVVPGSFSMPHGAVFSLGTADHERGEQYSTCELHADPPHDISRASPASLAIDRHPSCECSASRFS
jgi:hypothetical protein